MNTKIYPFPEDLASREIKRTKAQSERLKRLTDAEEKQWEQEATMRAMKYLVGERLKPSFLMIRGNVDLQAKKCDEEFLSILNTTQNGTKNPKSE